MATRITNQATLNYNTGSGIRSTISNTASVTMQGPLTVEKYTLENAYRVGDNIVYDIFVTNTSSATLNNVTIVDDLGTYELSSATLLTPLTYIDTAKTFIGDVNTGTINGVVRSDGGTVTFTIPSIPPGVTVLLQYKATVNEFAGTTLNYSTINNTVTVSADGVTSNATDTASIPVASYADVTIEKTMAPDPVVDGGTLTYTFTLRNYGTIPATDVVLRDAFDPIPTITNVTVDGVVTTDYSYDNEVFVFPSPESAYNYEIPAASFTQDPTTGLVNVTPGISTIVVQGTI